MYWHTSDVECDGIPSCDCGTDNGDSPKRLLRLSSTDKSNQITVSRNLFLKKKYILCCIYNTLCNMLDCFQVYTVYSFNHCIWLFSYVLILQSYSYKD